MGVSHPLTLDGFSSETPKAFCQILACTHYLVFKEPEVGVAALSFRPPRRIPTDRTGFRPL
jgi:hypothetical protein